MVYRWTRVQLSHYLDSRQQISRNRIVSRISDFAQVSCSTWISNAAFFLLAVTVPTTYSFVFSFFFSFTNQCPFLCSLSRVFLKSYAKNKVRHISRLHGATSWKRNGWGTNSKPYPHHDVIGKVDLRVCETAHCPGESTLFVRQSCLFLLQFTFRTVQQCRVIKPVLLFRPFSSSRPG